MTKHREALNLLLRGGAAAIGGALSGPGGALAAYGAVDAAQSEAKLAKRLFRLFKNAQPQDDVAQALATALSKCLRAGLATYQTHSEAWNKLNSDERNAIEDWVKAICQELKNVDATAIVAAFTDSAAPANVARPDSSSDIDTLIQALTRGPLFGFPESFVRHIVTQVSERLSGYFVEELKTSDAAFRQFLVNGLGLLETQSSKILDNFGTVIGHLRNQHRPVLHLEPPQTKEPGNTAVQLNTFHFIHQWLGFIGRTAEEERLAVFLHTPGVFRWWAVVGDGGVGKSRLAQHIAQTYGDQGWDAGFLTGNWLSSNEHYKNWTPDRPTLLILDYAAKHHAELNDFVRHMRDLPARFPVRLLILDRRGSSGAWFRDLAFPDGGSDEMGRSAARILLYSEDGAAPSPAASIRDKDFLLLEPFSDRDRQRRTLKTSLEQLGKSAELPEDEAFWEDVARITENGRPLFLQLMAVMIAETSTDLNEVTRDGLLDLMIEHDKERHWRALASEDADLTRLMKAIAFITLCRGLHVSENHEALMEIAGCKKEALPDLVDNCEKVLPGDGEGRLGPLAPDLLGERFLLTGGDPNAGKERLLMPFDVGEMLPRTLRISPGGVGETLRLMSNDFDPARDKRCTALFEWIHQAMDELDKCEDDFDREHDFYLNISMAIVQQGPDLSESWRKVYEAMKQRAKASPAAHWGALAAALSFRYPSLLGNNPGRESWNSDAFALAKMPHSNPELKKLMGPHGKADLYDIENW